MSTHTKHLGITNYFGYATIAVEWIGAILCMVVHPINLAEPFSQYGYYGDTKVIFGITYTIGVILYYLFSRNLNRYWALTSKLTALGGLAFIVTGWHTYTPYTRSFVFDIHNVSITLAILFFSLPMLFIGFSNKHQAISRVSHILFGLIFVISVWSIVARVYDIDFIYTQLATLFVLHTWIATVNYLHLRHHRATHEL